MSYAELQHDLDGAVLLLAGQWSLPRLADIDVELSAVALPSLPVKLDGTRLGEAQRFVRRVPVNSENAAGAVDAANRAVSEVLEEIAAWALRNQAGRDPRVEPAGQRPHLADAAAPK